MTKQDQTRREARRQAAIETAKINAEWGAEIRKALGWDRGRIEDLPRE